MYLHGRKRSFPRSLFLWHGTNILIHVFREWTENPRIGWLVKSWWVFLVMFSILVGDARRGEQREVERWTEVLAMVSLFSALLWTKCWQCQTANALLQVCFCTLLLVRPDWILCVLGNLVELCDAHIVQALEGAPQGSSWKMSYFCVKWDLRAYYYCCSAYISSLTSAFPTGKFDSD